MTSDSNLIGVHRHSNFVADSQNQQTTLGGVDGNLRAGPSHATKKGSERLETRGGVGPVAQQHGIYIFFKKIKTNLSNQFIKALVVELSSNRVDARLTRFPLQGAGKRFTSVGKQRGKPPQKNSHKL